MVYERDPVSVLFDSGAGRLLARAYADPGVWKETRVTGPEPRHIAYLAARGISPLGPDNVSARGGRGLDARSRWVRGFVRALYYQHRRGRRRSRGLEVQVRGMGRALGVIPAGRVVAVRVMPGGAAKRAAVGKLPGADRYAEQDGPGPRWSDPAARDW